MADLTPTEQRVMDACREAPPWIPDYGLNPVLVASILHGRDGHSPPANAVLRHMRNLVKKGQLVERQYRGRGTRDFRLA